MSKLIIGCEIDIEDVKKYYSVKLLNTGNIKDYVAEKFKIKKFGKVIDPNSKYIGDTSALPILLDKINGIYD